MKKSILLGAAALATMAIAGQANAGEVKIGGYYQFGMINEANRLLGDKTANETDANFMWHRLQLKMDMIVSEKTHAHMLMRPVDGIVEGANRYPNSAGVKATPPALSPYVDTTNLTATNTMGIRQLWMETEVFGVGVKVGEMPAKLNDKILVNDDDGSFGAIKLSKTFGNVTVIAADVRVHEGNLGGNRTSYGDAAIANNKLFANDDDVDLYVLTLLGKADKISYNLTGAYANAGKCSPVGGGDTTDAANCAPGAIVNTDANGTSAWWLAATVGAPLWNVDWTGTLAYKSGYKNIDTGATSGATAKQEQLSKSGWLAALRANSKTGFGEWRGYAFYASENFQSITDRPDWSYNYNTGFTGSQSELMGRALATYGSDGRACNGVGAPSAGGCSSTAGADPIVNDNANLMGIGVGLTVKAGAFDIKPELDYAQVTKSSVANAAGVAQEIAIKSAWGGSLRAVTELDKGTTLTLGGAYVDPKANSNYNGGAATPVHALHQVSLILRTNF